MEDISGNDKGHNLNGARNSNNNNKGEQQRSASSASAAPHYYYFGRRTTRLGIIVLLALAGVCAQRMSPPSAQLFEYVQGTTAEVVQVKVTTATNYTTDLAGIVKSRDKSPMTKDNVERVHTPDNDIISLLEKQPPERYRQSPRERMRQKYKGKEDNEISSHGPYITSQPYNYSHPLSKPLKVPYPILVLNLPKSGTTTIWQYFECGLGPDRAVHWWTVPPASANSRFGGKQKPPQKQIGPCLEHNILHHQPPLYQCGNFDVWIDCGYATPLRCFFPAVHALEAFLEFYPHATLLWIRRDVNEWYRSASKWGNMLAKWSTSCRKSFFPDVSRDETLGATHFKEFYQRTTENIRQFARDHPTMTYLEPPPDVTLSSPKLGTWLEENIGIAADCWGKCQPDGQNAKCE